MSANLNGLPDLRRHCVNSDEINGALCLILTSRPFLKAPRMRHLLSFLVSQKLKGLEGQLSEYSIGLEVFRRDSCSYDTGTDPVVRVQVGRLRERLDAYYATSTTSPNVRIEIPHGSYIPTVTTGALSAAAHHFATLYLAPLKLLSKGKRADAFVSGLEDELGTKLFTTFGSDLRLHCGSVGAAAVGELAPGFLLEGSVRVEDQRVRASIRLVDAGIGAVTWHSQFDRSGFLGISLQEDLALAICDGLRAHMTNDRT